MSRIHTACVRRSRWTKLLLTFTILNGFSCCNPLIILVEPVKLSLFSSDTYRKMITTTCFHNDAWYIRLLRLENLLANNPIGIVLLHVFLFSLCLSVIFLAYTNCLIVHSLVTRVIINRSQNVFLSLLFSTTDFVVYSRDHPWWRLIVLHLSLFSNGRRKKERKKEQH